MSIISYSEDKTLTINYITKDAKDNKKWYTEIDICQNPICSCQDITFELYDKENREAELPKHRLSIDVLEKKAVKLEGEKATSKEDFQLSKMFVKNFSENDWSQLQQFFLNFKRKISESTPVSHLNVSFPEKKIERDSLMIGYYDIFPYPEELWLELNDIKYLLDDQYCLASTCSCTHTVLTIIAIKNGEVLSKNYPLVIMFDYKANSCEVMNRGPKNIAKPKELLKEILRKRLGKIFKERHKKLRLLYKNFRKKKQQSLKQSLKKPGLSTKTNETKKLGRNEPCPCGSGKKYKKCCMLK
ncbi:SEC-C motif domain protein [Candidatus Magnetomorum sp. HK-1]|nr:SEC-C motif domain protein [Candidatus Magnetomorum sp. HK-1]